jgi:Putative zinc ribbon domain
MTTELCRSCGSCGFPMKQPDDYAGGDTDAEFCSTCGDAKGKLKPFNQAVEANANYFVREQGVDAKAAREMSKALLLSMPAWKARR